jgi:peptidoglycan hydrolase-like protein with peptidoglycan-binding domain
MLYNLGYSLGSYGIDGDYGRATEAAVKEFQRDQGLTVDGICGPMTWDALEKATAQISDKPKDQYYTVCIHHLDKTQADALMNNYPGATCTEE